MNEELAALNYLVCRAAFGNDKKHRGRIFDRKRIVFEALKRNEPLPITRFHVYNFYTGQETFAFCPTCNHTISDRHNFCPNCGQALERIDEGE